MRARVYHLRGSGGKDVSRDTLEEEEDGLKDNVPDQPLGESAAIVPEEKDEGDNSTY